MAPNILLIVVDALRADYVAPYNADADTPAIESLADEGTVFERAISTAPWTLPSVTSILTGRYPHEHGSTSRAFDLQAGWTLQDDLSAEGYHCVHVSPTTWLGEWLAQGRGFDTVEEFTGPTHRYFDDGADVRRLSAGAARGPAWYATVAKRALQTDTPVRSLANAAAFKLTELRGDHWLDRRASERAAATLDTYFAEQEGENTPFFAYVHLMDPHLPFYVPTEFQSSIPVPGDESRPSDQAYFESLMTDIWNLRLGKRHLSDHERDFLRTRYRDAVGYADSIVDQIVDHLDRSGLGAETLVVVTSDHGEHLGESIIDRTLIGHQTSIRLPVLRVPLVVRYPGIFKDAHRSDLVQTNYIAETVRALTGRDYHRSRSLLPGDANARHETAAAEYAGVVRSHPPDEVATNDRLFTSRRSAIAGNWKLDVVGQRRRGVQIDWETNETRERPVAEIPGDARARLEQALPPPPTGKSSGVTRLTDRDIPNTVNDRLADLGYR